MLICFSSFRGRSKSCVRTSFALKSNRCWPFTWAVVIRGPVIKENNENHKVTTDHPTGHIRDLISRGYLLYILLRIV